MSFRNQRSCLLNLSLKDVDINCEMTIDQTSRRGNLSSGSSQRNTHTPDTTFFSTGELIRIKAKRIPRDNEHTHSYARTVLVTFLLFRIDSSLGQKSHLVRQTGSETFKHTTHKANSFIRQTTNNRLCPHLSHHSSSRATTWGATVLDQPKRPLAHLLRPNTIKAQPPRLAKLLATHPFPARGYTERKRLVQTNHNVSLHFPAINSLAVALPTIS